MPLSFEEFKKQVIDKPPLDPLTGAEMNALQFLSADDAFVDNLSDEQLQDQIDTVGGIDNWIRLRIGLESSGEVVFPQKLPPELEKVISQTAEYALSRKTNRTRSTLTQTTVAFTQQLLDTKIVSNALELITLTPEDFIIIISDRVLDSMVQQLASMLEDLQNLNKPTQATEKLKTALTRTNDLLPELETDQRRSYCLQEFMEIDSELGSQLLGISTEQFQAYCETTDAIIAEALES